jgi:phosphoheptose isomerase
MNASAARGLAQPSVVSRTTGAKYGEIEMPWKMISHQVTRHAVALQAFDPAAPRLQNWGSAAARVLTSGGQLLACASEPGSRALARHLVAELRTASGAERPPLEAEAIAPADADGPAQETRQGGRSLAEQVRSRGRPGDILICFSAASPGAEVIEAVRAAAADGLTTWALTGPAPNQLAEDSEDAITVSGDDARVVEEIHLVAIHVFCAAADSRVRDRMRAGLRQPPANVA